MEKYLQYATLFGSPQKVHDWLGTVLKKHLEKHSEVNQTQIEHIIDFLSSDSCPTRIKQMTYAEALKSTEKWNKTLIKKGAHIKELPSDTEVVLDFGDGFKVVKLIGQNAYKREGYLMGHCVGGYFGNGKTIYSLRDKNNMPHCTMEKDQQVKGKGNKGVISDYVGYIVKFLEFTGMTVGDSEMKHLGYVNVEDLIKKEPDLVFPELFNEKYFLADNLPKVKNRDRISLWSVFSLLKVDSNFKVSFNFDITASINAFLNSTAVANELNSVALISDSRESKVKATKGSVIVIIERNNYGSIIFAKCAIVDGETIKEDTWYTLKNGEFVEVNE